MATQRKQHFSKAGDYHFCVGNLHQNYETRHNFELFQFSKIAPLKPIQYGEPSKMQAKLEILAK